MRVHYSPQLFARHIHVNSDLIFSEKTHSCLTAIGNGVARRQEKALRFKIDLACLFGFWSLFFYFDFLCKRLTCANIQCIWMNIWWRGKHAALFYHTIVLWLNIQHSSPPRESACVCPCCSLETGWCLKSILSLFVILLSSVVTTQQMTLSVKDCLGWRLHQTLLLSAQLDCRRHSRAAVICFLSRQRRWRHGLLTMSYLCLCQEHNM